jgi:hypothetical protein
LLPLLFTSLCILHNAICRKDVLAVAGEYSATAEQSRRTSAANGVSFGPSEVLVAVRIRFALKGEVHSTILACLLGLLVYANYQFNFLRHRKHLVSHYK